MLNSGDVSIKDVAFAYASVACVGGENICCDCIVLFAVRSV